MIEKIIKNVYQKRGYFILYRDRCSSPMILKICREKDYLDKSSLFFNLHQNFTEIKPKIFT